MNFYIKLKPWQLGVSLYGIPIILTILLLWIVLTGSPYFKIGSGLIIIITNLQFFAIIWTYGIELFKSSPIDTKLDITNFRIGIIYSIIFSFVVAFLWVFSDFGSSPSSVILLIGGLISGYYILYCFTFIAKQLRTIELGHIAEFENYSKTFYGLLLSMWGIVRIKSRIDKAINQDTTHNIV